MNILPITTKILKPLETSSSLGLFARDTGGCLISRLLMSRTKQERKEVSFLEISESLIFYFLAPIISKIFSGLYSKISNQKIAKTAQIVSVFGLLLPLVYSIAPLRNLITLKTTGQNEFLSVVGLAKNKEKTDVNKTKEKNINLIKKSAVVSALSLLTSSALLLSSKSNKLNKKINPFLDKFNKIFNLDNGLNLLHYGALIYPASILGYLQASRDKYEKMENIRRFSVSVPLLLFGDKLIEKPIYKGFDKLFKTSVFENNKIKSYDEILKIKDNKQLLKSKNFGFALNFLTSTVFVALGVGLLNRIETKKNYEKENNLNKNV